ncbi:MAG: carbohydrate porin [Planctomycetota bacterium]
MIAGTIYGSVSAHAAIDPVRSAGSAVYEPEPLPEAEKPGIRYEIAGLIAGGYQFEIGTDNENEAGALTVRPGIDVTISDADRVFLEFGITQGNGVNADSPFALAPWGADLEDDLENINGSDVDALQNFWYRRTLDSSDRGELAVTVGFVDSTEFIDQNEFANDEYMQFRNEVFVNGPTGFLQSYDLGAAVEWSRDAWSVNGTVMRVAENDNGNPFWFGGVQLGYATSTSLGEGNYRVVGTFANDRFARLDGSTAPRLGLMLSADQQLGETFGVWTRLGTQDDRALITYENMYSGGVSVSGGSWGRPRDTAAVGYAYLDGGNDSISSTHVVESYYRVQVDDDISLTLDVQRTHDHTLGGGTEEGWVVGGRAVLEF